MDAITYPYWRLIQVSKRGSLVAIDGFATKQIINGILIKFMKMMQSDLWNWPRYLFKVKKKNIERAMFLKKSVRLMPVSWR